MAWRVSWRGTAWRQGNVLINLLVIGGGATILLSPLASRFLYNGKAPLLALVRQTVIAQMVQATLRIWIEVTTDERRWQQEAPRAVLGLVSFGGVIAVGRFIWNVIATELDRDK